MLSTKRLHLLNGTCSILFYHGDDLRRVSFSASGPAAIAYAFAVVLVVRLTLVLVATDPRGKRGCAAIGNLSTGKT